MGSLILGDPNGSVEEQKRGGERSGERGRDEEEVDTHLRGNLELAQSRDVEEEDEEEDVQGRVVLVTSGIVCVRVDGITGSREYSLCIRDKCSNHLLTAEYISDLFVKFL